MANSPFTAAFETAVADRWILQGEIGRGTQTTVYRAHDAVRDVPVVVKALDASLASALDFPRFRKQMLNAADCPASRHHPADCRRGGRGTDLPASRRSSRANRSERA